MFEEYPFRIDAPIQSVVDRDRGALTALGAVPGGAPQGRFLADGLLGVFSVDNRLRVG